MKREYCINMTPVSADAYIDHIEARLAASDEKCSEWSEWFLALEEEHAKLLDENMKLKAKSAELVAQIRELWYLVNHRSAYGYAAALEHIEELGIEVENE